MRNRFLERGSEAASSKPFGSNAQNRFAEAIDAGCGLFKRGGLRIAGCAGDHHLQSVARVKQRGESVGGREQTELRSGTGECFESFLRPIEIERVSSEAVEAIENHWGNGIRSWRGRILERFAADFQAAQRRRVGGAIEEAAVLLVAIFFDGQLHQGIGPIEIAGIESCFIRIEEGGGAENLIIECAFEFGAADTMDESFVIAPGFGENDDRASLARNRGNRRGRARARLPETRK